MATHDTPRKKSVARCNGVPKARRETAIPSPRPAAEAETEPRTASGPVDEAVAAGGLPAARRPRHALLAVKATIILLIVGSLTSVCLAIHRLAGESPQANVYVGLAGVGVAGVGACVPVYLHLRRKDPSDGGS